MTRFWSTLAIVNAIWATTGTVDALSVLHFAVVIWCLVELRIAARREVTSATQPGTSAADQ